MSKSSAHAVAGDHGTGQLGGLLNIVGGTGGDGVEDQLLGRAAAGEGGNLISKISSLVIRVWSPSSTCMV